MGRAFLSFSADSLLTFTADLTLVLRLELLGVLGDLVPGGTLSPKRVCWTILTPASAPAGMMTAEVDAGVSSVAVACGDLSVRL